VRSRATRIAGLACALALPLFCQGPFAWKDIGDGRMELREGGKVALVYNYGPQLKPGAPENKKRCCYVFPVSTPSGLSILDDFPRDHWHHRGLFWSWPIVEVGGKKYDIWMNFTAKHRPDKPPVVKADAKQARLDVEDFWEVEGRDIVRENVRMIVLPTQGTSREMDIELTWTALKEPVTLQGSAERGKSYGGFSARFAARENTVVRADGETLTKDEDLNPRHWAELEGVYGGRKAVLRITSDDKNPGAPLQWCLRNYGFIGASYPGRTATVDKFTLEPGKPLTLKFRVKLTDLP
jgi:hypothetical protein